MTTLVFEVKLWVNSIFFFLTTINVLIKKKFWRFKFIFKIILTVH
jgi:hypothetical protein